MLSASHLEVCIVEIHCKLIARIFRRGLHECLVCLVCMYACIIKDSRVVGSGGMLPKEILEIRCSEIASEAILGQKQSCSMYIAHRVLHPGFGCHI